MNQDFAPPISLSAFDQTLFGSSLAATILEQFDHGILLLDEQGRVLAANRIAHRECSRHGALRLSEGRLTALRDADRLLRALSVAARGQRTLLHFDGDDHCLPVVVLPLSPAQNKGEQRQAGITMVLMAKRNGSEPLNIELFGKASGLTMTERQVLKGLCAGLDPAGLARAHGVALSTVRTQLQQIRQKTGAPNIRALMNLVNNLPPVVCATEMRV